MMETTTNKTEITYHMDGIDYLELYIGGHYLTTVKIDELSEEAKLELGFDN